MGIILGVVGGLALLVVAAMVIAARRTTHQSAALTVANTDTDPEHFAPFGSDCVIAATADASTDSPTPWPPATCPSE